MKELSSVVATNDIYEKLTVIKQRLLILSNQIIVLNQLKNKNKVKSKKVKHKLGKLNHLRQAEY